MDYAPIPNYATRLGRPTAHNPTSKTQTSLPKPDGHNSATYAQPQPQPTSPLNMIPQILLSSTLHIPDAPSDVATNPHKSVHAPLLSIREPLSIPTTTINFKRFVAKSGPVFWFQDRVEEVVMWRKGWRVTGVWMAVYTFLCAFRSYRSFVLLLTSWVGYFPRMILLIPHTILISIIISTHPSLHTSPPSSSTTTTTPPAQEGTIAWQTNIQGIQNLMGALSDLDDFIRPHIPCITHSHSGSTPYTHIIFMLALTSFVGLLLILPLIPIRAVALFVGLTPLVLTHPFIRALVLAVPPALG